MSRVTVCFREEQLETVITALGIAADDEAESAELLAGVMGKEAKEQLKRCQERRSTYARTAMWLEHLREEQRSDEE